MRRAGARDRGEEGVRGGGAGSAGEDDEPRRDDVRDVEDAGDERAGDEPELDGDREPGRGRVSESPFGAELRYDRARREPGRHRQDERRGEERERPRAPAARRVA